MLGNPTIFEHVLTVVRIYSSMELMKGLRRNVLLHWTSDNVTMLQYV